MAGQEQDIDSQSPKLPPSLSGKKVAVAMLVGMLVVGGGLGYSLWVYSQLDAARQATRQTWRNLASELDSRYRASELQLARGIDAATIPMEVGERFRLAVDRFRTTSDPLQQQAAAQAIEDLLQEPALSPVAPATGGAELPPLVDQYNAQRLEEQRILSGPGGRALDIFLEFPQTAAFRLSIAAP